MRKLRNYWAVGCLAIFASCSTTSEVTTAPKDAYRSIPAGLIEPCVVKDIEMKTVADIVMSRGLWKSGFEKCSAKVDAVRKHDAEMREAAKVGAE